MNTICCFAGHSQMTVSDDLKKKLKKVAEKLITKESVTEFWVGRYGDFDSLAAEIIRELKEKYPHITLTMVIPYLTPAISNQSYIYNAKYDDIIVADIPLNTPHRYRIIKCNEYMIKNSAFLIAYVRFSWGGAHKTLEYARRKKHIKIFNLAEN